MGGYHYWFGSWQHQSKIARFWSWEEPHWIKATWWQLAQARQNQLKICHDYLRWHLNWVVIRSENNWRLQLDVTFRSVCWSKRWVVTTSSFQNESLLNMVSLQIVFTYPLDHVKLQVLLKNLPSKISYWFEVISSHCELIQLKLSQGPISESCSAQTNYAQQK